MCPQAADGEAAWSGEEDAAWNDDGRDDDEHHAPRPAKRSRHPLPACAPSAEEADSSALMLLLRSAEAAPEEEEGGGAQPHAPAPSAPLSAPTVLFGGAQSLASARSSGSLAAGFCGGMTSALPPPPLLRLPPAATSAWGAPASEWAPPPKPPATRPLWDQPAPSAGNANAASRAITVAPSFSPHHPPPPPDPRSSLPPLLAPPVVEPSSVDARLGDSISARLALAVGTSPPLLARALWSFSVACASQGRAAEATAAGARAWAVFAGAWAGHPAALPSAWIALTAEVAAAAGTR